MITIPEKSNSCVQIPAKTTPKNEQPENLERIGVSATMAAKMIAVSERTVWNLAKSGKIHSIRIGKRCIFSVQSLREFVDGIKVPSNSSEKGDEL